MAQSKEEQKAKEAEKKAKQEQIEFQRQQMKEQQMKSKELERAYAEQAREASRSRNSARVYSRSSGFDEPSYFIYSGGQENQSQLTIRNSFDGETDSSEGEFDVNESTTHIRCTINGKARSGKINIKVLYPGGKVFKNLSITSSAEISFTQSISVKEEETIICRSRHTKGKQYRSSLTSRAILIQCRMAFFLLWSINLRGTLEANSQESVPENNAELLSLRKS